MASAKTQRSSAARDAAIIVLSIGVAIALARTGALADILTRTQGLGFLGSFLAGMCFVSLFTVAPAAVVLVEIAQAGSVPAVAFFGGLGALAGDLIIFRFMRESVSADIAWLVRGAKFARLRAAFRRPFLRWLVPLAGAAIVASPFPDEIGVAMMGLAKMRTALFIPLSFTLNFLGILAIGWIAKGSL